MLSSKHCNPTAVFSLGMSQSFGSSFLLPNMSPLGWVTGSQWAAAAEPGKGALDAREGIRRWCVMWVTQGTTSLPTARLRAEHHQAYRRWTWNQDSPGPTGVWVPHLISGQLVRVRGFTKNSTLAIQVLKWAAATHCCKSASWIITSSLLLTPSPFVSHPRTVRGVTQGKQVAGDLIYQAFHRIIYVGKDLESNH